MEFRNQLMIVQGFVFTEPDFLSLKKYSRCLKKYISAKTRLVRASYSFGEIYHSTTKKKIQARIEQVPSNWQKRYLLQWLSFRLDIKRISSLLTFSSEKEIIPISFFQGECWRHSLTVLFQIGPSETSFIWVGKTHNNDDLSFSRRK